jgi:hypothetical protein
MQYSEHYLESVQRNSKFQLDNKTWNGGSTLGYYKEIKALVDKHNAKSLLDYGCGKALHYKEESPIKFEGQTFDKFLGIETVFKHDPCVAEYSTLPPAGQKFDAVIMIQALGLVPDKDVPWVVELLMEHTAKFCYIGNVDPGKPVKEKKRILTQHPGFSSGRDMAWYENQFKNWKGSEIVISWT